MGNLPATICAECGRMVPEGGRYCPLHVNDNRQLRAARDRNTLRRAGGLRSFYDTALWRVRTRRFVISRDPLCQIAVLCSGRDPSTDVDHIIRAEIYIAMHGGDESFFYDPQNLRGACHADHAHKTSLENRNAWDESKVRQALAVVVG